MPIIRKTRYIILGLLAEENLSGYDIKQKIDKKIGVLWMESYGQIYPELKRLAEENMISLKSSVRQGRVYNEYSITKKGKETLLKWLKEPPETKIVKYDILLKMFFAKHLKFEEVENHLKSFQNDFKIALNNLINMKTKLGPKASESKDLVYWHLVALFGENIFNAYIQWSEKALEILNNLNS